jgi:hypothetical protein
LDESCGLLFQLQQQEGGQEPGAAAVEAAAAAQGKPRAEGPWVSGFCDEFKPPPCCTIGHGWSQPMIMLESLPLKKTSNRLFVQEPSTHEMQFVVSMLMGSASQDALPPEWQVGSWDRRSAVLESGLKFSIFSSFFLVFVNSLLA